jgi:hypothetical protein
MPEPQEVTSLDDVMQKIIQRVHEAGAACKSKVLPGTRPKIMLPLQEANALLKAAVEVLDRSGMGKKLGFIKTQNGIQPVVPNDSKGESEPVKEEP